MKTKPNITKLKLKAQNTFNAWVRERDKDLDGSWTCICCGKKVNKPNASHYAPVKLYPSLRFNEYNVNVSCIRCNMLEGNAIAYRKGLIKKIGEDKVIELENQALDPNNIKIWDLQSLTSIIQKYEKNRKNNS